jgi:glutamate carboxypeptidase
MSATAAKGPGITDMKGGNVVMIQALRALQSSGALKSMNIVVVMTGDEEAAGRPLSASRAALVKAAQGADVALGFEDGDGDPKTAVIGRRGTSNWELRVKGKPAHSSQIFNAQNGYGAIFEAARILNAFREKLAGQPHLTFNPGVIVGGTSVDYDEPASRGTGFGKSNVIAEHTVVTGDVRALSPEQFAAAKKSMQDIVAAPLPRTRATLTFDDGYPALAPTPGNQRLLALYNQASLDVGGGAVIAVDPDKAGAADVSFISAQARMILDGLGLMGSGGHTVDEVADLTTLPLMAKRMAVLLARLHRDGAK